MSTGIFKRADVAFGRLITHYHRSVFRELHDISLPSQFCCYYWFGAPLSPAGQLQEGTGTACSFPAVTAHKALVFVESRRDGVTGLGLWKAAQGMVKGSASSIRDLDSLLRLRLRGILHPPSASASPSIK